MKADGVSRGSYQDLMILDMMGSPTGSLNRLEALEGFLSKFRRISFRALRAVLIPRRVFGLQVLDGNFFFVRSESWELPERTCPK